MTLDTFQKTETLARIIEYVPMRPMPAIELAQAVEAATGEHVELLTQRIGGGHIGHAIRCEAVTINLRNHGTPVNPLYALDLPDEALELAANLAVEQDYYEFCATRQAVELGKI